VRAVVVDLIAQFHVSRSRRGAGVGDHGAAPRVVALLERQARRRQTSARARGAHGVLAHESLQMLIRRRTIAACLLQLRERE
jgi:hypothetical protein